MREAENIREVEQLGVSWLGFIFHPGSPRFVNEVPFYLPEPTKRVGVFVNERSEVIMERVREYGLSLIQLHGNESPSLCQSLREAGLKVIKAFSIESHKPFPSDAVHRYEGKCDYFLFDTKTAMHGGSGRKFDWQVLDAYHGETPFLLSGGISPEDTKAIGSFSHPKWVGIDLNSRFETSPGIKEISLLRGFIERVRQTTTGQ